MMRGAVLAAAEGHLRIHSEKRKAFFWLLPKTKVAKTHFGKADGRAFNELIDWQSGAFLEKGPIPMRIPG